MVGDDGAAGAVNEMRWLACSEKTSELAGRSVAKWFVWRE